MQAAAGRRVGKRAARALAVAMLAALALGVAAARDESAELRNRALAGLKSPKAEERASASRELGEIGRDAELPGLLAALHDESEEVRRAAEQAIWRVWSRSGDAATDRVFESGVAQMQGGDLRAAAETFGQVIGMKPEFAEGWNKRATVWFMLGEDDRSLRDCDEVIKRNPYHFGVLAGYGQIHLRKRDLPAALGYFERALAINPNMAGVRDSIDAIGRILAERRKRFI